jgi:transcription initiation factor TFIIH subunit 3
MASDRLAHLSLVLDLAPAAWAAAAGALPLASFLAQLLAFLHAHLAGKHENTLAVYGALPARAVLLYASGAPIPAGIILPPLAGDSYRPFDVVDAAVVGRITAELAALSDADCERVCTLLPFLSHVPTRAQTRPRS